MNRAPAPGGPGQPALPAWPLRLALAAVLALHAAQVLSLGPWAAHWPRAGAWPQGFHAWLLEGAAGLVAAAIVLWHRIHPRVARWPGPRRALGLSLVLVAVQLGLAAAHWWTRHHGVESLGGLRAAFHLGGEFRLPALFAAGQALLAATLAWAVYRREGERAWAAVAGCCAYIGADELLSLHERVGQALRSAAWPAPVDTTAVTLGGGVYVFAWQLVFLPLAAALGLWMLDRFRRVADGRTLAWLVLAAALFVGGAVGMETLQATGAATQAGWRGSDAMHLNLVAEETLETLGMTVAVHVLANRAWASPGVARPRGCSVDAVRGAG